jgi:hypothetical protein
LTESVTVAIGELGLRSLGGAGAEDPARLPRAVAQALRYYLADRDAGRVEWPFPAFLRDRQLEVATEVAIPAAGATWEEFEREAERQGVGTDQLAQHAVLYLVADWDSGRLVERILDRLEG